MSPLKVCKMEKSMQRSSIQIKNATRKINNPENPNAFLNGMSHE
ncbi:MAG: hypothetical protein ACTSWN_06705 [Promethearchaeota archaeon]